MARKLTTRSSIADHDFHCVTSSGYAPCHRRPHTRLSPKVLLAHFGKFESGANVMANVKIGYEATVSVACCLIL